MSSVNYECVKCHHYDHRIFDKCPECGFEGKPFHDIDPDEHHRNDDYDIEIDEEIEED